MNSGSAEYLVFEKTDDIWRFMEEKWSAISSSAIEKKGYFTAALSGGKTPVGFYEHLSTVRGLPWDKTHIFVVDERFVPPESPDSNYGMLRKTLLSRISLPTKNIHPIATVEPSVIVSAEKYKKELKSLFNSSEGVLPEFDLVLLGVGEDGHTASLFPGTEALKERERLVVPVMLGTALHDRITLTLPVINHALNIFFLVSGRRKRAVMRKLRNGHDMTLPAAMVKPEKGTLTFLMDREAAG
ncbi:MAG: 6-phosphogluconolactonase [Nitrospirae bacterium]|nr:6-phosphogluconolactonase [Nitrospirota bacterium]